MFEKLVGSHSWIPSSPPPPNTHGVTLTVVFFSIPSFGCLRLSHPFLLHHSIIMEEFNSWGRPVLCSSHSLAPFLSWFCSVLTAIGAGVTTLRNTRTRSKTTLYNETVAPGITMSFHFSTASMTGANWFLLAFNWKALWSVSQKQTKPPNTHPLTSSVQKQKQLGNG